MNHTHFVKGIESVFRDFGGQVPYLMQHELYAQVGNHIYMISKQTLMPTAVLPLDNIVKGRISKIRHCRVYRVYRIVGRGPQALKCCVHCGDALEV